VAISELVTSVTQVRCVKNGQQVGSASGFFYKERDELFLITNRHRPQVPGSRPYYGEPLIDWIEKQYRIDPLFFSNAYQTTRAKT